MFFKWGFFERAILYSSSPHLQLEAVDLSTHSFSFSSALLFFLSYSCFSLDLLDINLFLVEFRPSLRLIACFRFAWCLLSFKVYVRRKEKKPLLCVFFKGLCCFLPSVLTVHQKQIAGSGVCVFLVLSCSLFVCLQIVSSKPVDELLHRNGSQDLSSHIEAPHDYDSGNDTSSPPSSKTGVSRASVADIKRSHCQRLASPEKLKFNDRDNVSDSGNSVTSYASLCRPYGDDGLSAALFSTNTKR